MENVNELRNQNVNRYARYEQAFDDYVDIQNPLINQTQKLVDMAMNVPKNQEHIDLKLEKAYKDVHLGEVHLSEREQKARYKQAQKKLGRFKQANYHFNEMSKEEEDDDDYSEQGIASLKGMLKSFGEVSSKSFHYKSDSELCDHFAEDYKRLKDQVKNGKAAKQLLLSQRELSDKELNELLDLRARSEAFEQMKQLMELKIALMTNPYYVVLSKEDTDKMSFVDLEEGIEKVKGSNADLARYYATLLALKGLGFNRKLSFSDLKASIRKKNTEKWKEERKEALDNSVHKSIEEIATAKKAKEEAKKLAVEQKVRDEIAAREVALNNSTVSDEQVERIMKLVPDIIEKYRGNTAGWILDQYDDLFKLKLKEAIKTNKIADPVDDGGDSLLRMSERYNRNVHTSLSVIDKYLSTHPEATLCNKEREDQLTKELVDMLGSSFFEKEEEVELFINDKANDVLKHYQSNALVDRQKKINEAFPDFKYNKDFWRAIDTSKLMDDDSTKEYIDFLSEKINFYNSVLADIVGELAPAADYAGPLCDEIKKVIGVRVINCTLEQYVSQVEAELNNPLIYQKMVNANKARFEVQYNNRMNAKKLFEHKEKSFIELATKRIIGFGGVNSEEVKRLLTNNSQLFLDIFKANDTIRKIAPQIDQFEKVEDLAKLNYEEFMKCYDVVRNNVEASKDILNDFLSKKNSDDIKIRVLGRVMNEKFNPIAFDNMVEEEKADDEYQKELKRKQDKSVISSLLKPLKEESIQYSVWGIEKSTLLKRDKFKLPARVRKSEQAQKYWKRLEEADCRLEMLMLLEKNVEIEKLIGLTGDKLTKNPIYETFKEIVTTDDKRDAILSALSTQGKELKLSSVIKEFKMLDFNAELLSAGGANAKALLAFSDTEYEKAIDVPENIKQRAIDTARVLERYTPEDKKLIYGNLKSAMVNMIEVDEIKDEKERRKAELSNIESYGFRTYYDFLVNLELNADSGSLDEFKADEEVKNMSELNQKRTEVLKQEDGQILAPILPYLLKKSNVQNVLNTGSDAEFEEFKKDIIRTFAPFISASRKVGLSNFEYEQYLLDNFDNVYKGVAVSSNGFLNENMTEDAWINELKHYSDTFMNTEVPGLGGSLNHVLKEMNEEADYRLKGAGRAVLYELMRRDSTFMKQLIENPKSFKESIWKKLEQYKSNTAYMNKQLKEGYGSLTNDSQAFTFLIARFFDLLVELKPAEFKAEWKEYGESYIHSYNEIKRDTKTNINEKAYDDYKEEKKAIENIKIKKAAGLLINKDQRFLNRLNRKRIDNPYIFNSKASVLEVRKNINSIAPEKTIEKKVIDAKLKDIDAALNKIALNGQKVELPDYVRSFLCDAMATNGLSGDKLIRHIRWILKVNEELGQKYALSTVERENLKYEPDRLEALELQLEDKRKKALLYLYINSKDHKIKDLKKNKNSSSVAESVNYGTKEITDLDVEKYGKQYENVPLTEKQRKALDKELAGQKKEDKSKKEADVAALNITNTTMFRDFELVYGNIEELAKQKYEDVVLANEVKEDIKSLQYAMYHLNSAEVSAIAENRKKYYAVAASVYELLNKQLDENPKTAALEFHHKRYLMTGLREYLKKDIYDVQDTSINKETWTKKINDILENDHIRKNITNANSAVYYTELQGDGRLSYDEKSPDDVLRKLLECKDKDIIKKFKRLNAEEQQLFFAGLSLMSKKTEIGEAYAGLFDTVPGEQTKALAMANKISEYVSGKQLELRIDYGRSFYNMLKKNSDLDIDAVREAFTFVEEISKKRSENMPISMDILSNAGNTIMAARELGKPQWRELSNLYGDFKDFRKGILDYLVKDSKKKSINSISDAKKTVTDKLHEGIKLDDIRDQLMAMDEADYKLLSAILKDRTMMDYVTVDAEKIISAGNKVPHVNAAARQTFKDLYLASHTERAKLLGKGDTTDGYTSAMQSMLSFQIKENISDDGVLSKSDFEERSFERSTLVDWQLVSRALRFMKELKEALAKKNIVSKAPELIEKSGNAKAIQEYNKIKDLKEMSRDTFEQSIVSQIESDEQAVLWGGYNALTDRQKALFIRALEHREILDISKKNLVTNVICATDRDYVDSAARYALIDEYIENAYAKNGVFACSDVNILNASKSLLSTQIADDLTANDYASKSIEELQAVERLLIKQRTTAIDWKLFKRALQFVMRTENEKDTKMQNMEMHRSMGNLLETGRMDFSDRMLRRNIHTTGNRIVNRVARDMKPDVLRKIPTGTIKKVLSKVLNTETMNSINSNNYQLYLGQTLSKKLENQVEHLENAVKKSVNLKYADSSSDMRDCIVRATVELMMASGVSSVQKVDKILQKYEKVILKAAKLISAATFHLPEKVPGWGMKAGKYAYKWGKSAGKYAYAESKYFANKSKPVAEAIYKNVAEPVGRFVYKNGEYVYIGAKAAAGVTYMAGRYILTSPQAKYVAMHGAELAKDSIDYVKEHKDTAAKIYNYTKGDLRNFKNIKDQIGNIKELKSELNKKSLYEAKDQVNIIKAGKNQTDDEHELSQKGIERNDYMIDKGAFYLKGQYFDSITSSVIDLTSDAASVIGGVAVAANVRLITAVKGTINLIAHYIRDAGAIEDFYKGPGKLIADRIMGSMYRLQDDKNEALAKKLSNATDSMSKEKVIRIAQGYENEREHAMALGLNIVHSILFSASKYNPNIANRNLAAYILKALKLEELEGKYDDESAIKLYKAFLTA